MLPVKIGRQSLSLKLSLRLDGSTAWIRNEFELLKDRAPRLNPTSISSLTTLRSIGSKMLRNTTLRFSRRSLYEPLDGDDNNYRKITSSRRKVISHVHPGDYNKASGNNYKRERAKKRLIFLQSYKLGSDSGKLLKSRKLKKAAIKVKSVAVSFVSFVRISSLRSCKSGLAISRVFSPRRRIPAFC